MKKGTLSLLFVPLVLTAGCIPTENAIYTDESLVFDPALIGGWNGGESKANWEFTKKGEQAYRLVYASGEQKRAFTAHLVKIDESLFLNLHPELPKRPTKESTKPQLHHTFVLVKSISPTLQLSYMDAAWLKKHVEENPTAVRTERMGRRLVVTDSTEQLQAFLAKHRKTGEAWKTLADLKRRDTAR
jgi:hypothetical protein